MKKSVFNGTLKQLFSARVLQGTHRFNNRSTFLIKNTFLDLTGNPLPLLRGGKSVLVLGVVLFLLNACSPVPPFVDARREAGQSGLVGQSTPERVAVCYNRYATRQVDVDKVAAEECKKTGRRAVLEDETKFTCCLVAPATAFFRCEK